MGELQEAIQATLARLEAKIDALLAALAEEDATEITVTLDGHAGGAARDERAPL